MGLCNTERYAGVLRAAKRIYQNATEMPDAYDTKPIRDHALNIWASIFGSASNSVHWFMGSSATNEVIKENSPWAVALMGHWKVEREKDNFFNKVQENAPFDPFDGFLDISGILELESKSFARVYDVYAWTEQLIYYLRRYDDEFVVENKELSDWASVTMGLCFSHFEQYQDYAKAYLYHQICEKLYKNDVLEKIARKQCWHHNLRSRYRDYSLEDLMNYHMRLFEKEPSLKTIFEVALELQGRSYHYDHLFKEFTTYLKEEHGYTDTASFKKIFDQNKKKKEEYDSKSTGKYREERKESAFLAIHGYDWKYKQQEKEEQEKAKKQATEKKKPFKKTVRKKNVRNSK